MSVPSLPLIRHTGIALLLGSLSPLTMLGCAEEGGGEAAAPAAEAGTAAEAGGPEQAADTAQLSNTQKASYLMGQQLARQQPFMAELDMEWLGKGLRDGVEGNPPQIPMDQAQAIMQQFGAMLEQKQADRAAGNLAAGEAHMAEIAKQEGTHRLESGLVYEVLEEGDGPTPEPTSTVKVHYTGKLIDGRVFDASKRHGNGPMEMNLGQVIPGWTQAISKMPVGSKWRLHIPSRLAYGERDQGMIGANSTLIFDVELVDIVE